MPPIIYVNVYLQGLDATNLDWFPKSEKYSGKIYLLILSSLQTLSLGVIIENVIITNQSKVI